MLTQFDKDGTPIVRNEAITAYAEAVLADYRPELLEEPGKIDGVDFIENYLGANLEFQDIYYPDGGDPIAGAAIFNDTRVKVFDRDRMSTTPKFSISLIIPKSDTKTIDKINAAIEAA